MAKNRPIHEIRVGKIKALVWANETVNGVRHNVTVARLYKDGHQWRSSDSFGQEDLPTVCKVLDLTHTWIFQATADDPPVEAGAAAPKAPAERGSAVPAGPARQHAT